MKRKILVILAMLTFMLSLPVVSASELEAKDADTLVTQLKAAQDADTVKITDNITYAGSGIMVEGKKTVTLDMNGFNITIDLTKAEGKEMK